MGHYGGSYKVTYGLYKKYGDMRVMDTPICGECGRIARSDGSGHQGVLPPAGGH